MLLKTGVLAVLSVLIATAGQLLLRTGMERVGYVGAERLGKPLLLALQVAKTPHVVLGFVFFATSAIIWVIVLSRAPLSFAYPFAGLTYVLITLFSRFVLKEHVATVRWIGIVMIALGVVMVGTTAPPDLDQPPAEETSGVSR